MAASNPFFRSKNADGSPFSNEDFAQEAVRWANSVASYNYLTIGGNRIPGLVLPIKAEIKHKLDTKASSGSDGGTLTSRGLEHADIHIQIRLWTYEQYEIWNELVKKFLPTNDPKNRGVAYSVFHPSLERLGINTIFIFGINEQFNTRDQTLDITISAKQQFRALGTTATAKKKITSIVSPNAASKLQPVKDVRDTVTPPSAAAK